MLDKKCDDPINENNNLNNKKKNKYWVIVVIIFIVIFCVKSLNNHEKIMLKYMNDKYPDKTFYEGKTRGHCADYYCSMYVYEKSEPNREFSVSYDHSTKEITYNGYAKKVIQEELAKNEVEKAFKQNKLNLESVGIEFYNSSGGNMFDDSSLEAFIQKHNPKRWMIWATITDEGNLEINNLLSEALKLSQSKLCGEVSFTITIKNDNSDDKKTITGKVADGKIESREY